MAGNAARIGDKKTGVRRARRFNVGSNDVFSDMLTVLARHLENN